MGYCKKFDKEVNEIDRACDGWAKPFKDFGEPEICKHCKEFSEEIIKKFLEGEKDE